MYMNWVSWKVWNSKEHQIKTPPPLPNPQIRAFIKHFLHLNILPVLIIVRHIFLASCLSVGLYSPGVSQPHQGDVTYTILASLVSVLFRVSLGRPLLFFSRCFPFDVIYNINEEQNKKSGVTIHVPWHTHAFGVWSISSLAFVVYYNKNHQELDTDLFTSLKIFKSLTV